MTAALIKQSWLSINIATEWAHSSHWMVALQTSSISHWQSENRPSIRSCAMRHNYTRDRYTCVWLYLVSKQVESIDGLQSSFSQAHRAAEIRNTENYTTNNSRFHWQWCIMGRLSSNKCGSVMEAVEGTMDVFQLSEGSKTHSESHLNLKLLSVRVQ